MSTIPLYALLVPCALFAVFFVIFSLVNLYHLFRFGSFTLLSFAVTFCFLGGAAIILSAAYTALQGVDWTGPLFTFASNVSI